jgi:two-component system CheB/CheR fusion protein
MERIASIAQELLQFAATGRNFPPASGCRLILLEDNDSVRAATELFLTLAGYDTRSAGTVAEAEPLLAEMQPEDIFISDYQLGGKLTGLDVLQELRVRYQRDVPAILLSGDLQSLMRIVKNAIPRCHFLSKPVDAGALLGAITELNAG